jgi:hypothetical protein
MGQTNINNETVACNSSTGGCTNFSNVGPQYCDKTSSIIAFNTSCANYALTNKHPNNPNKTYWEDYI